MSDGRAVVRGGSWSGQFEDAQFKPVRIFKPNTYRFDLGFRVVKPENLPNGGKEESTNEN